MIGQFPLRNLWLVHGQSTINTLEIVMNSNHIEKSSFFGAKLP